MSDKVTPVNRTGWPAGEWDNEPDRHDFVWAGFSCLCLRNDMGAWCGYVAVGNDHPLYGMGYNDWDKMPDLDVHGGLTYSDKCQGEICHTPQEGMPDDVWWFGFDTAHLHDYVPGLAKYAPHLFDRGDSTYKDMEYAIEETKHLAEQLSKTEDRRIP